MAAGDGGAVFCDAAFSLDPLCFEFRMGVPSVTRSVINRYWSAKHAGTQTAICLLLEQPSDE